MYTDTMVPKMGNKLAYNDHLSRNGNSGYHVHVDMNDFGQINKQHGERMGDHAIKQFGGLSSEVSRMFGGKAFRNGGDEFKFWFHRPEAAHGFARELRSRLEKQPKVGGTHNLAASVGIGYNPDHAESSLLEAKKQLGPTDALTGKRQNLHKLGDAPSVIHSKSHEAPPPGWKPPTGKPPAPIKSTPNMAPEGLKFHNPLTKDEGAVKPIQQPIPSDQHPALSGGRVGIMTAENPYHPVAMAGGNASLESELRQRGMKFEKITGKYAQGAKENSFLIHDIDHKSMMDLGKRYGQDSVIHSHKGDHKLIFTNGAKEGQYHAGSGHVVHPSEPDMYYSTLQHNGSPVHFALNLDFDHLHNPTGMKTKIPNHEQ
jgi:GGDEF domain-containing protein